MFKKLFGGPKVPPNNGDTNPMLKVDTGRWVKVFELELSNMEDTPTYQLTHQLSIGSEIGNIVIADPSISPRHCTFIMQQEVISVLDHGSVSGTFVNGTKIPPGKYIILEDTDIIVAGDLEVRIKVKTVEASVEEIPEVPEPQTMVMKKSDFDSAKSVEDEVDDVLQAEANDEQEKEQVEEDGEEIEEVEEDEEAEEVEEVEEEAGPVLKKRDKDKVLEQAAPGKFDLIFGRKSKSNKIAEAKAKAKAKAKSSQNSNKNKKSSKSKSFSIATDSEYSANSILRVIAVSCDLLLSYSIYVVFSPFDEFREFLDFIPAAIADLIDIDWKTIWATITEDYGFLNGLAEDAIQLFNGSMHLGPILLIFILLRLATTFLLGVSISERFLGIVAKGNGIWARIGGALRVIIGAITGPFVIFDVPALVSRRTFKEFMTFTQTFISSKFFAILGTLLYFPLCVAIALFSPLMQGLEPPEAIVISDRLEQKIRVATDPAVPQVAATLVEDSSTSYHLDLKYDPANVEIIPLFKFKGNQAKTQYQNQMAFLHKDLQRTVTLEVYKKFDLKQLLGIGMRGNVFIFNKFPQIHDFVYTSADVNPSLRGKPDSTLEQKFANEFIMFTKMSFDLDVNNAFEFMQAESPLIRGFIEYRSALLALLEYKDFESISFSKIGNQTFMKIRYLKQKPFDLIIPLVKGEGRIYKVEFDKKETLGALNTKFYKYTLDESHWNFDKKSIEINESLTPMQVLDVFANLNFKKKEISPEKAQALYGYYFEKSSKVVKDLVPTEYALWKESVQDAYQIMEVLSEGAATAAATPKVEVTPVPDGMVGPPMPVAPASEDPRLKLLQNFKDLKDAVDSMNKTYFGLEQNPSV